MEDRILPSRLSAAVAQGWCRFEECLGQQVTHKTFGTGTIVEIDPPVNAGQEFRIDFADGASRKQFGVQKLLGDAGFFTAVTVPSAVYDRLVAGEAARAQEQEQERHRQAEITAAAEQEAARQQAEIDAFLTDPFVQTVYKRVGLTLGDILKKWELTQLAHLLRLTQDTDNTDRNEVEEYAKQEWPELVAVYFERRYAGSPNNWDRVKASRYWRQSGRDHPHRRDLCAGNALQNADPACLTAADTKQLHAALWTTRAAALKDLARYQEAEPCVHTALSYETRANFRRVLYAMLSAIDFTMHRYDAGHKNALLAQTDLRGELEPTLLVIPDDKRRSLIEYLLKIDPALYGWTHKYRN